MMLKQINLPKLGSIELNFNQQLVLEFHGVLRFDKIDLVLVKNDLDIGALQCSDEKAKKAFISKKVPKSCN